MTARKDQHQKPFTGFRPVVRAREGRMFGIRQPLDGPVFDKLEDAEGWCIHAMASHYDRRLGMSDGQIEPFKGMMDSGLPPDPALLQDVTRICEQVAKERSTLDPSE
jgi:hypothetical protein